jgi:hypothetical protein
MNNRESASSSPSTCALWRRTIIQSINEQKWDQIEKNPCTSQECTLCQSRVTGPYPLKPLLTIPIFTRSVQNVIERIYGPLTPDDWYRILLENISTLSTLRYFIENRLIDIQCGRYNYTIFVLFSQYYRQETFALWDELLSLGYDINLQDSVGDNALLAFLRFEYYDGEEYDEEDRLEESLLDANQKIAYLLQRGADPLLENKDGVSAWSYVRTLSTFPQQVKDRLVQLLAHYV